MIRFIFVVILLLGFLAASSLPLLIGEKLLWKNDTKRRQEYCLKVVQSMFRLLLRVTGSTVIVKWRENIPDQAVLYVGNHRSYFDILVGYVTVPGLTGFVAKREMLRYPVLRRWMQNVNCLFLDREDIKAGLKTILDGIEKIKKGVSIWIFPEGTRNTNYDVLDMLPFKEGSLRTFLHKRSDIGGEKACGRVYGEADTGNAGERAEGTAGIRQWNYQSAGKDWMKLTER